MLATVLNTVYTLSYTFSGTSKAEIIIPNFKCKAPPCPACIDISEQYEWLEPDLNPIWMILILTHCFFGVKQLEQLYFCLPDCTRMWSVCNIQKKTSKIAVIITWAGASWRWWVQGSSWWVSRGKFPSIPAPKPTTTYILRGRRTENYLCSS